MADVLQLCVAGIAVGCAYGIVGLTFTAIYNASRVINLAQGEFVMLGTLFAYYFLLRLHWNFWATLILIIVLSIIFGLALEWVVVRPLNAQHASIVTIIIATMAAGMIVSGGVGVATKFLMWRVPAPLGMQPWRLGSVAILPQNVLVIIATVLMVFSYWFLLNRTMRGRALKATGIDADMATLVAISVSQMVALSFIISAAMAGLAGLLVGPLTAPTYSVGFPLVVKGFVSAIVGGLGNPYAAVVGGIIVGVLNVWLSGFAPAYAEVGTFAVLLIVLLLRPYGLFGEKE